jgi:hypothetical protein
MVEDLSGDWRRLDERIEQVTDEIKVLARENESCRQLMIVPGIGPFIASAMVGGLAAENARHGSLSKIRQNVKLRETRGDTMPVQVLFGLSVLTSFVAVGIVAKLYIAPRLKAMPRENALRCLIAPHMFRFVGLSFLVPGVVSPALSSSFAAPAASATRSQRCSRSLPPSRSPHALPGPPLRCGCSTFGALAIYFTHFTRA